MIPYEELVLEILKNASNIDIDILKNIKRTFAREYNMDTLPSNIQILRAYRSLLSKGEIKSDLNFEKLIKKRSIRSESGIVAVQVLTKPFRCPGQCIFCPNDPTMPKSYIKTEPGAMRALLNHFDPIAQVYNRLISLSLTWHKTDKIEMIVLWWTRDVYPDDYKISFIKSLYDACNSFSKLLVDTEEVGDTNKTKNDRFKYIIQNQDKMIISKDIEEAIKINERSENRIIWLTLETRPEYVTDENCQFRRRLWVTRIEMWLQSMFDDVLEKNKRWHSVQDARMAVHKLRQYGFKISIHIMPWLYGSDMEKDFQTFEKLYSDVCFKPDEIKFYPTSVIPNTELYNLYIEWKYKPLETEDIKTLVKKTFLNVIPAYTRIKRLIRDIPATEIVAWSNITNLSQLMHDELKRDFQKFDKKELNEFYARLYPNLEITNNEKPITKNEWFFSNLKDNEIRTLIIWSQPDLDSIRNFVCLDTRSREIRNKLETEKFNSEEKVNLVLRIYKSSVWVELFISFEDGLGYLYGFTRLLLPQQDQVVECEWLGKDTAMIRELHVYGNVETIKKSEWENIEKVQHKWFWKQLMEIAENISRSNDYGRLSVISGVGVREYYEKIWYELEGTYLVKKI